MATYHHWTVGQAQALFDKPLLELLFEAQQVHRQHFDPRQVQVSTLLSIKTGACPEDCKYCPQSSRYKTGLESERLMQVEQVLESAKKPKPQVRPASVWARRGKIPTRGICLIWRKWLKASRQWGWKPV